MLLQGGNHPKILALEMRYSSMHTEMAATQGQPAVAAVGDTVQVRRMAEGGCAVAVAAIDFGDPHVRDVSGAGTSISGRRERLQLSSGPAVHMISLFDPIHATLVDDFSSNERYALSASRTTKSKCVLICIIVY